jgi:type I restriction enzyme S subunit
MAGEWRDVALEDVADELTVGYVGPMASEYVDNGVPFLRSLNVEPLRINKNDLKFITPEFHRRIQKSRLTPGDVVIVRTGKPGACCVVPEWLADANCSDLVIVRCGKQLSNRFLAYYVNTMATGHVAAHLVGAVQQHFNVGSARTLRLRLPPLAEQNAIAAVLGALDDKIELNRRMNAKLEEMARALFQCWFVDFDPVRAKMDGRETVGMDKETASLFPEYLEEMAFGPVPNGWGVQRLGEVVELAYGKPLKAEDRKHGCVCVYGANGAVGWHNEKLVSGPGIVIGRKGNPGVVTWSHGDFYPIDTTFYVEPIGKCRSLYFLYYVLLSQNLANLSADSAVPGLNRNHAYMSKQVIPSQPVLSAFDSQIAPIFAAMHTNEEQSRNLALVRDTLLPKLLSGELTVPLRQSSR